MEQVTVMFRIDSTTLQALKVVAKADGNDIGDVVRDAIKRDLFRRSRARKSVRTDEQLVAPLRALLAADFARSCDWRDLQNRLRAKGYELREAGAGLAVFETKNGLRVAKASDFGTSYSKLIERFRSPFPGHSHSYLFDRMRFGSAPRNG